MNGKLNDFQSKCTAAMNFSSMTDSKLTAGHVFIVQIIRIFRVLILHLARIVQYSKVIHVEKAV